MYGKGAEASARVRERGNVSLFINTASVHSLWNTIHTKMEYKYNPARVHLEYTVFVFTI